MKSFSRLNLIQERLAEMFEQKQRRPLFQNVKPDYVILHVRASEDDLLRADTLIDDVIYVAGGYIPSFGIDTLIALLYRQFLDSIIRGEANGKRISLSSLAQDLCASFVASLELPQGEQELMQKTENKWSLEEKKYVPRRQKQYLLKLMLNRKEAHRGEMALKDMHKLVPSFRMTLEQLISLLFYQFVAAIRIGNQKEMIDDLIETLGELQDNTMR